MPPTTRLEESVGIVSTPSPSHWSSRPGKGSGVASTTNARLRASAAQSKAHPRLAEVAGTATSSMRMPAGGPPSTPRPHPTPLLLPRPPPRGHDGDLRQLGNQGVGRLETVPGDAEHGRLAGLDPPVPDQLAGDGDRHPTSGLAEDALLLGQDA